MGWVQLDRFVKLPDRHPDDPDEHYVTFRIKGDGTIENIGYVSENPATENKKLFARRDEVGEGDSPRVVGCDDNCGALLDPITPAEIQAALVHWRDHGQWGGCSHGR